MRGLQAQPVERILFWPGLNEVLNAHLRAQRLFKWIADPEESIPVAATRVFHKLDQDQSGFLDVREVPGRGMLRLLG